jgi:hypothetical protein
MSNRPYTIDHSSNSRRKGVDQQFSMRLSRARGKPGESGMQQFALKRLVASISGFAMLLKELGFDHTIVSTVSLHAGNSPFHGRNHEA